MSAADLTLIWAQSTATADRPAIIGRAGRLPWQVPEDLAHFREMTRGRTVIMGRRTWDSLPAENRPLPNRRNIVVTRDRAWTRPGAETAASIGSALTLARPDAAFVIGGGEIYAAMMPLAARLEVTEIDYPAGSLRPTDTVAPVIDVGWRVTRSSEWLTSVSGLGYRFMSYVRGEPDASTLGDQRT